MPEVRRQQRVCQGEATVDAESAFPLAQGRAAHLDEQFSGPNYAFHSAVSLESTISSLIISISSLERSRA